MFYINGKLDSYKIPFFNLYINELANQFDQRLASE